MQWIPGLGLVLHDTHCCMVRDERTQAVALFGAALAGYHHTDALQHFNRRAGTLGQEGVGAIGAIECLHTPADQDRRHFRGQLLHAAHELVAVHVWHDQVAQNQIDPSLAEQFQCLLTAGCRQHPVSSSLKHEFANGKSLFVVVDTQNSFLWAHGSLNSPFKGAVNRGHTSYVRVRRLGGERNKPRQGWRQLLVAQRPACGHHTYGDSRSSYSSGAHPSASDLNSIVRVKADSRVTSTATLGQSTKMKAMCKRRRSNEMTLAFSRRFHRYSVSCCQCCLSACLALLKACESFKEKTLFCYRISAAKNKKNAGLSFDRLSFFFFSRVAHHDDRLWHT